MRHCLTIDAANHNSCEVIAVVYVQVGVISPLSHLMSRMHLMKKPPTSLECSGRKDGWLAKRKR